MNHMILGGAGQVGSALAEVLDEPGTQVGIIEPGWYPATGEAEKADWLHVCIPWTDRFTYTVTNWAIEMPNVRAIVVHSTVPVGVCDSHGWAFSPITGKHPYLAESLRTFTKPVGGPDLDTALDVAHELHAHGIPVHAYHRARDLEAGKLLDLAIYGANIRLEKEIWRYCQENDIHYETAYRDATTRYNDGYRILSGGDIARYDLEHVPGPVGGHCVAQNLPLLGDQRIQELVEPATADYWDDALD